MQLILCYVYIPLYHRQTSLYPALWSLYWMQLILCYVYKPLYDRQTSLYPVLWSLYWMQLILYYVYKLLYHRQTSLYPVLWSLYWMQLILYYVYKPLYHRQTSLYPVLWSLYWMQLILYYVYKPLYHRQTSLYPVLWSFYWMQLILYYVYIPLCHKQTSLYPVLWSYILDAVDIMLCTNSILAWANIFASCDVIIMLGVLDIILWKKTSLYPIIPSLFWRLSILNYGYIPVCHGQDHCILLFYHYIKHTYCFYHVQASLFCVISKLYPVYGGIFLPRDS